MIYQHDFDPSSACFHFSDAKDPFHGVPSAVWASRSWDDKDPFNTCMVQASWRDPAFPDTLDEYSGVMGPCPEYYHKHYGDPGFHCYTPSAQDLADDLYDMEWHTMRSILSAEDKLEFIRLIHESLGKIFPSVIKEALELVPKYERRSYPRAISRDKKALNAYVEYDATEEDDVI